MSGHTTKNGADVAIGFNGDSTVGLGSSGTGILDIHGTTTNVMNDLNVLGSITGTSIAVDSIDSGTVTGQITPYNYSIAVTKSSATTFLAMTITDLTSFSAIVDYCITAKDATDVQTISGSVFLSGVRKGATTTGGVGIVGTQINAVSTGTHTNTFTVVDAGDGKLTFKATSVPSITPTSHVIKYTYRVVAGSPTVSFS